MLIGYYVYVNSDAYELESITHTCKYNAEEEVKKKKKNSTLVKFFLFRRHVISRTTLKEAFRIHSSPSVCLLLLFKHSLFFSLFFFSNGKANRLLNACDSEK